MKTLARPLAAGMSTQDRQQQEQRRAPRGRRRAESAVARVHAHLRHRIESDPEMCARAVRAAVSQALAGREHVDELSQEEKRHIGKYVEQHLRTAFDLPGPIANGPAGQRRRLDTRVLDVPVEIKFTLYDYGWMFPPESVGAVCLVVSLTKSKPDDNADYDIDPHRWLSVGVVQPAVGDLGQPNRDSKRQIFRPVARLKTRWLVDRDRFGMLFAAAAAAPTTTPAPVEPPRAVSDLQQTVTRLERQVGQLMRELQSVRTSSGTTRSSKRLRLGPRPDADFQYT